MARDKVGEANFSDATEKLELQTKAYAETTSVKAEAKWKSSAVGTHGVSEYDAPRLDPSKQVEKAASQTNDYVVDGKNLEPKGSTRTPLPVSETHEVVHERIIDNKRVRVRTIVEIDDFVQTSPASILSKPELKESGLAAESLKAHSPVEETASFKYQSDEELLHAVFDNLGKSNVEGEKSTSHTFNTTSREMTPQEAMALKNQMQDRESPVADYMLRVAILKGQALAYELDAWASLTPQERSQVQDSHLMAMFNMLTNQFVYQKSSSIPEGKIDLVDGGNSPRVAEKIKQMAEQNITIEILIVDDDTFNELSETLQESYEAYIADLAQKLDVSNKDKVEKADREHEDFLKKSLQASYEQTMKSVEEASGATIWLEQLKVLFDEMMARSEYNAYLSFVEAVKAFAKDLKAAQDEKDAAKIEFFQEEIRRTIQQQSIRFDINIEEMIKGDIERKSL